MKTFKRVADWLQFRQALQIESLGFVPTMGALHEGHLSLVRKARSENSAVLVSIFVNPTQFNDTKDFTNYPIQLSRDLSLLQSTGCDYVLAPEFSEMYPDGYRYKVTESTISQDLCGANRPGHFDGVLTVVLKLLQIAGATRAYFGEKDYQQYQLIKGMAEAFFLPTHIVPCPIVREASGLAMSSRNELLSPAERQKAARFHKRLVEAHSETEAAESLKNDGYQVDYIKDKDGRRFGAIRVGTVRLIDNVEL